MPADFAAVLDKWRTYAKHRELDEEDFGDDTDITPEILS